jgi:hypothetical protein
MRYLGALNGWLDGEVHDRQSRHRVILDQIARLRKDLSRLIAGLQAHEAGASDVAPP